MATRSKKEKKFSEDTPTARQIPNFQGGYECQLVSPPPNELICLICLCIARVPYQVQCCGRVFCAECLTLLKLFSEKQNDKCSMYECPHCRHNICPEECFMDVRAALNIRSLMVKCKNVCNGCEWTGELRSLETHQDECGFTIIVCPHEDGDNATKFLRKDLHEHYENECPKRIYRCRYCRESGEYQDMINAHLKECPDYMLPVIIVHPHGENVRSGGTVVFSVQADMALCYQWRKDRQIITPVTHSYCRGANTARLTIRAAGVEHEGCYSCAVSNDLGSVVSNSAELGVVAPPEITESPCHQTKLYGDDVTFTVTATGKGTIRYQWSKDGEDIASYTHPYCTGATTSSLSIAGVITQYEGSYMCCVSNEAGAVESQNAILGVVSPATRLFQKEGIGAVQTEDDTTEEQKHYPTLPPLSAPTRLYLGSRCTPSNELCYSATVTAKATATALGATATAVGATATALGATATALGATATAVGATATAEEATATAEEDITVDILGKEAREMDVQLMVQNLSPSSSSILLPSDVKLFSPIYNLTTSCETSSILVRLTIAHYACVEPGEATSDFMILQSSDQSPPYQFRCLDENTQIHTSVLQDRVSCTVHLGPKNFYAIGASIWRRAQFNVYFIQPLPKVSQQCMYALFAASYKHTAFEELLLSEVKRRFEGVAFQHSKHIVRLCEGSDRFELVPQDNMITYQGYSLIPVNKDSLTVLADDLLKRDTKNDPRLCMPPTVLLRVQANNPHEDLECVLHLSGVIGKDHEFVLHVEAPPPTDQPTDDHGETQAEGSDSSATPTKILHEHVRILAEILCTHAGKWKFIGTCLGFTQPELGTLEADLRLLVGGPQAYLTAMLDQWTTWPVENLGVEHKRCATLEDLEKALRSRLVGLGVVASELRAKFEQGCEDMRAATNEERNQREAHIHRHVVAHHTNEVERPVPDANFLCPHCVLI